MKKRPRREVRQRRRKHAVTLVIGHTHAYLSRIYRVLPQMPSRAGKWARRSIRLLLSLSLSLSLSLFVRMHPHRKAPLRSLFAERPRARKLHRPDAARAVCAVNNEINSIRGRTRTRERNLCERVSQRGKIHVARGSRIAPNECRHAVLPD